MNKMVKVAYICNRKKQCNMYELCGIECNHTFDEYYTANGIIRNVKELETDRFRKICTSDEVGYYEEVIK